MRIFAGSSSRDFVRRVCSYLGVEPGSSETFHFPEGNTYVKIGENVRRKDLYLVQTIGFGANDALVELLFWIDAFKRASAASVTVVMPFFGYAKADKKDEPRVSIRARVCADCIEAAGADRVVTMDLHSPQIQGFFKIPVDHLYAYPLLCEYVRRRDIPDLVVVSPDAGFAKSARRYSSYLGLPTAICDKARSGHGEAPEVLEVIGEVEGMNALIVDDFSISCGTLAETARALKAQGARKVYAMVTHALLTAKGLAALDEAEIEELFVTDTVENPAAAVHPKIRAIPVAPFFGEALRIIEERGSLSALFEGLPASVLAGLGD
jgi:ribose-phosphate pyrophosphokinase